MSLTSPLRHRRSHLRCSVEPRSRKTTYGRRQRSSAKARSRRRRSTAHGVTATICLRDCRSRWRGASPPPQRTADHGTRLRSQRSGLTSHLTQSAGTADASSQREHIARSLRESLAPIVRERREVGATSACPPNTTIRIARNARPRLGSPRRRWLTSRCFSARHQQSKQRVHVAPHRRRTIGEQLGERIRTQ